MEAVRSSKSSLNFYPTKRSQIQENNVVLSQGRESLKWHAFPKKDSAFNKILKLNAINNIL